jgi:branched-chain amino acid transport system substrate-binding protein
LPGQRCVAELRHRYNSAATIVQVLKQAATIPRARTSSAQRRTLRDFESPMLLRGLKVTTCPTDYYPVQQLQLMRFHATR